MSNQNLSNSAPSPIKEENLISFNLSINEDNKNNNYSIHIKQIGDNI